MIDIEFFKEDNDTCGHRQGEQCLRAIATAPAQGLPPPATQWPAAVAQKPR